QCPNVETFGYSRCKGAEGRTESGSIVALPHLWIGCVRGKPGASGCTALPRFRRPSEDDPPSRNAKTHRFQGWDSLPNPENRNPSQSHLRKNVRRPARILGSTLLKRAPQPCSHLISDLYFMNHITCT